ncbi:MAG TPA: lipoprotein insertase outer membrane protein LolB [Rudaea sp.]|nr:lipoprotein insertase outer membrane protein LolB [Rudaea sp.]
MPLAAARAAARPRGRHLRSAAILTGLAVLAACAPVRVRETPATTASQNAREAALGPRTHWRIDAHISVSDGRDGGSGDLTWEQDGGHYVFTVRAPVTGKTWRLSGDARQAQLVGVEPQPVYGADPQRLLHERTGWDVPLAALGSWVRGMRAPGPVADLQYDAQNLPAVLEQDGWKIEYRDWFADSQPAMPRKLFASRGSARVRMAIEHWSFDD